jgi:hypothetical protein
MVSMRAATSRGEKASNPKISPAINAGPCRRTRRAGKFGRACAKLTRIAALPAPGLATSHTATSPGD